MLSHHCLNPSEGFSYTSSSLLHMSFFSKPQTTLTHLTHSHTIVGTPFLNSINNDSDKDFSKLTLQGQETGGKSGMERG